MVGACCARSEGGVTLARLRAGGRRARLQGNLHVSGRGRGTSHPAARKGALAAHKTEADAAWWRDWEAERPAPGAGEGHRVAAAPVST